MLRRVFKIFSHLPLQVHYFLADYFLYPIIYHVLRYRRKIVRKNLALSFPEKSYAELLTIEKKFYHHLCDVIVEVIYGYKASKAEITERVHFLDPAIPSNLAIQYGGFIGMLAHYGNWEWINEISNQVDPKVKMLSVYRKLKSHAFDTLMMDIREQRNTILVEKNTLLREMIRCRAEKIPVIYGMIADQKPTPNNAHFWMDFLNQDTSFLDGSEILARKFNYPIYYVRISCPNRGHYSVDLIPLAIPPFDEIPMYEITKNYARLLEEDIKSCPELWLWSHNRWKFNRFSK